MKIDILNRMRNDILTRTKISTFERGSIIYEILDSLSSEIDLFGTQASDILNESNVSNASGENLDNIGLLVGISRNDSARSYGDVEFSINPEFDLTLEEVKNMIDGSDIIIPAGTGVSSANAVNFTTTTSVTLENSPVIANVVSTANGAAANIGIGEITTFTLPSNFAYIKIKPYIMVQNKAPIDNGRDIEDDETFRFRITNAYRDKAKANELSIRVAALSVPGVQEVFVRNFAYGIGTFGVYVISESPIVSDVLLSTVQEAINQVTAVGVRGVVQAPSYEAVHMEYVINFQPGVSQTNRNQDTLNINNAITDYINSLAVGDDLVPQAIAALIYDTSINVKSYTLAQFGRGEYNFDSGRIEYYEPLLETTQTIDNSSKWVTNKTLINICEKS